MPEMKTVLYTTGRLALGFWRLLDGTRRALLNLLFLGLLVLVAWLLLRGGGPAPLQEKTALVLALDGPVREQFHGSLRDNAINRLSCGRARSPAPSTGCGTARGGGACL